MTSVEDRLRDALRERAARSPIDPDAWPQTVARTRRADRTSGWFRFGIPAAAAAAVAGIVVGATALTGLGGPHGGPAVTKGATPTASPSGMPAPPGPGNYEMQSAPPVTAVVPVKLIVGGQTTWTFVWFGYLKNDRAEGIVLCTTTDGDGYDGGGGCGPANVPPHQVAYSNGPYGSITMGTSLKQVTSVSAQLAGGHTVPGVVVYGRGFPYKFWAVVRWANENDRIIFRGASGAELGHLDIAAQYPAPSRPRSGGITVFRYPAGVGEPTAGRMDAYLFDGRGIGVNGKVVGFRDSANSSQWSGRPASGPPTVVVFLTNDTSRAPFVEFFGYAQQDVARVVLRLADGRQYGAQTFAAWPGSGLRLWAFPVPTAQALASPAKEVVTGYDAAGHVVYQRPLNQTA
jgi:hypothetical protein